MQMVQPGERTEDIRRLVTRPELDEAGWALTRKLADRRLVVTDRDPLGVELAEVSHEALIHGWERLQDWVKADRIFLAWLNRLRAALRQWQASGRDEGALLRGRTLAEAEGWLAERRGDLSQAETEFIQASVALRKGERAARERLRNLILAGAILAAILMALLGAFGWNRSQEARRQAATAQAASTEAVKQQATAQAEAERAEQAERIAVVEAKSLEQAERIAQAQLLATQGQLAYVEQPLLGLRLALEGLALAPAEASDARASILASLQEMAKKGCLLTLGMDVERVHSSPDGSIVVVDHGNASGELRRLAGGEAVPLAGEVGWATFSPDGATFVMSYIDAPDELRRTAGGDAEPLAGNVDWAEFSPEGGTFVVDYYDATDELRRTAGGEPVPLAGEIDWDVGAYFSPDGAYFAVFYRPAWLGAELRRTSDGEVVPLAGRVEWLSFSPDGATFVVDYIDAPDELRRMAGGEPVPLAGEVDWVKFSPDGALFVVRYADAPDELRKTAGGDAVPLAFGVQQVFFSPDGATFVVAYSGAPGELRRTAGGEPHRLAAEVSVAVFSPDGAYFVVVYAPGYNRVELHRTAGGAMRVLDQFNGVRFSPDGSTFLVGCTDGRYEVWGGESFLADLGLGMKDYSFDPHSDRLVVWHTDGQAYLLDLAWLRAMGGNPAALPPEELVRIICEGPLASGLLDEAALEPYLGGREPQACQY
jgi:hypothetical protein